MYQLEKISKEQIDLMIAMGQCFGRGYKCGVIQKLLLDFVNSGERISKVKAADRLTVSNINKSAKNCKINVKAFSIEDAIYLANLTLIDAQK